MKTVEIPGQQALIPAPPAPRRRAVRAGSASRWVKIKVKKRERCDACMAELAHGEHTHAAHLAMYRWSPHDGPTMCLCYLHTNAQREAEGLAKVRIT